jgi:hypothetical protein
LTQDFFEIDFLPVETKKSGDAIALRYSIDGQTFIHVTDGGFSQTGDALCAHIEKYYDNPTYIHNVILTHSDLDHAKGLGSVLNNFVVGALWMNRPWIHAAELLGRFARYTTFEGLEKALRDCYPHLDELEQIAIKNGIPIYSVFQGQQIGAFHVLSPSRDMYLELVLDSDKTPDRTSALSKVLISSIYEALMKTAAAAARFIRGGWGDENFSADPTSRENEMSVIQYANLCGSTILLTGDAGREALSAAADYAPYVGLTLPGIDYVQVPHHGSRRNLSSDLMDRWFGPRLASPAEKTKFQAVVSSALEDPDHPRKAVIRAFHHRGAHIVQTEGNAIRFNRNAPARTGWVATSVVPYPDEQEA